MPHVVIDGVRIAYDDVGRGEPALLLLPGWCVNRSAFADLVARLKGGRRVLALDWRGHGESGSPEEDFGAEGLLADALAVVKASGAERIVPVALADAGWVAIELKTRLGGRVSELVLIDWIVTEAPPPFAKALRDMQSPERWLHAVDGLFSMWTAGAGDPRVERFVRDEMGAYGFEMWSRAARVIQEAYARHGSPLKLLSKLAPPVQTLHLYSQPDDPGYLEAQQAFAGQHTWFHVRKLNARSHFPMLEVPDEMAAAIEEFVAAAEPAGARH